MPTPQQAIAALLAQLQGTTYSPDATLQALIQQYLANTARIGTESLNMGGQANTNIQQLVQQLAAQQQARPAAGPFGEVGVVAPAPDTAGITGMGNLQQQLTERLAQISAQATLDRMNNAGLMSQIAAAQAAAGGGGGGGGGGGRGGRGGYGGGGSGGGGDRTPLYDDRDVRGYNRDQTQATTTADSMTSQEDIVTDTNTTPDPRIGAFLALNDYEMREAQEGRIRGDQLGNTAVRTAIMGLLRRAGGGGTNLGDDVARAIRRLDSFGVGEDGRLMLDPNDTSDDFLATPGGRGLLRADLESVLSSISDAPSYGSSQEVSRYEQQQRLMEQLRNQLTSSLTEGGTSARGIGVEPVLPLGELFPGYGGFEASGPTPPPTSGDVAMPTAERSKSLGGTLTGLLRSAMRAAPQNDAPDVFSRPSNRDDDRGPDAIGEGWGDRRQAAQLSRGASAIGRGYAERRGAAQAEAMVPRPAVQPASSWWRNVRDAAKAAPVDKRAEKARRTAPPPPPPPQPPAPPPRNPPQPTRQP